ncbi:hypothetical protein ADK57_25270 [Streptomyces sp. MMG1533]|uniref:hypothetical protein n=1 Tax=Streptomyces sp. MMG1533 TaxID=1415546 RepID=UPI0006AF7A0D|nr:hypothetical protein [Streptomyces sp. MMG1533]KOU62180.1 hypothetical protein ADK57_25270 [Streptomyces sp. MMG1533]
MVRDRDRVADVTGVVSVGQYPAISGEDLAEAFSTRLGRTVTYEATDPHAFFAPLAPAMGEQPGRSSQRSAVPVWIA